MTRFSPIKHRTDLAERRKHGQMVKSHPLVPATAISASVALMMVVMIYGPGLGLGIGTAAGSVGVDTAATAAYSAPNAPTVTAVMFLDTAGYANAGAFVGSLDDSISYTVFEFDSLRGTGWNLITPDTQTYASGRSLRSDTILTITAGDTFKVRALQHGMASSLSSAYSAVDTFVASAGVFFQMDLSAGASPLAGFDGLQSEVTNEYTLLRVDDGGGPAGAAYYRLTHDGSTDGSGSLQPNMGWYVDLGARPGGYSPGYGDDVFVRFWFRFIAATRCESWNSGSSQPMHETKFHIVNNSNPPGNNVSGRTMIGIDCEGSSGNADATIDSVVFSVQRANGGQACYNNGVYGARDGFTHSNDTTWVAFQYRLTYSSAEDATDASYALWIDNQTEGSPDCEINNDNIRTLASPQGAADDSLVIVNAVNQYDLFQWGFFWNTIPDLSLGGVMGYELTGYEVGTTFDATWGN